MGERLDAAKPRLPESLIAHVPRPQQRRIPCMVAGSRYQGVILIPHVHSDGPIPQAPQSSRGVKKLGAWHQYYQGCTVTLQIMEEDLPTNVCFRQAAPAPITTNQVFKNPAQAHYGGVFAQRAHSAGTAPIITVIIQVTTLKTTHLRNHAQSIQNSKVQTSDACHGSQGPKFCPL